ncbi:hypothetical protein V8C86DRAFT_3096505 [Haematococcus lacustris]
MLSTLRSAKAKLGPRLAGLVAACESVKAESEAAKKVAETFEQVRTERDEYQSRVATLTRDVERLRVAQKASAALIAQSLSKVEAVVPHPKRYLALDDVEAASLFSDRLDLLVSEHTAMLAENQKLVKANASLSKKNGQLSDQIRDEAEVFDREVRRLGVEAKRTKEAHEAELATVRAEAAEQLAMRQKEVKLLQKRLDTARVENEAGKQREKAAKASQDEAIASANKAQEEARAAARKAQDARHGRETAERDLEACRSERDMMAASYHQVLQSLATYVEPSALPFTQAFKPSAAASWPRTVFTVRGSAVLHSRACGAMDSLHLQPRTYTTHQELAQMVLEGGCVLCTRCSTEGGF